MLARQSSSNVKGAPKGSPSASSPYRVVTNCGGLPSMTLGVGTALKVGPLSLMLPTLIVRVAVPVFGGYPGNE